jgi:branched-chain amino acid transport system permease protein
VTGGFNGRIAPDFSLLGFSFGNKDPQLFVAGVEFREAERLWYLGLLLVIAAYVFAKNLLRSRPGRALQTLRDSEVAASVMGVNVQRYKARVFLVSSMYAGLAGVLTALSIGSIAPESFGLLLSISFLAMIVLGGLGSVGGAAVGAAFVSALPAGLPALRRRAARS